VGGQTLTGARAPYRVAAYVFVLAQSIAIVGYLVFWFSPGRNPSDLTLDIEWASFFVMPFVWLALFLAGLWFLRMEVTAPWFVAVLRAVGLPYFRQHMSVDSGEDCVVYTSQPDPLSSDGGHHIVVRPGDELRPPEGGPWERFVTARWGAFHRRGRRLLYTPVEHEPWRLHAAEVPTCSVDALFREAGLSPPTNPPVAQFSPGVRVRVGMPKMIR
jgi:hypothetical protein